MSNILHGPPENIDDLTQGTKSLGEYVLNQFKDHGDEPIVFDAITNVATTARELYAKIVRVAECLSAKGISRGDRVAICSENRVENCFILFGTFVVGATLTPISSDYGEIELTHMLNTLKPKVIFISKVCIENVLKVKKDNSFDLEIIDFDEDSRCNSFKDFMSNSDVPSAGHFECEPENIKENVAVIISSSGTTGMPKGVEITQFSLFSNIGIIFEGGESYVLVPSPLSYVSGFMTVMSALTRCAKCVLLPKFEPELYLSCIEKYKVVGLFFNPALMYFMAKSPSVDKYDLSSIEYIYYGAAPVSNDIVEQVLNRLKNVKILQFYAMTEMCSITMQSELFGTLGSVGMLRASVSGKVVSLDTGENLGPNQRGELMFKSNRLMKRYTGDPEATREAFDKDGFFHTGDIGYYNERGEWFIVDRMKELIKYFGNTVSPAAIEKVLISHPKVRDCCVVGLPDEKAIELPLAFVVCSGEVTESELMQFIADNMSDAHQIRGGVIFTDAIPKNTSGSGKTVRKTLKVMAIKEKQSK